jgi:hypothetical protein
LVLREAGFTQDDDLWLCEKHAGQLHVQIVAPTYLSSESDEERV